MLAILPSHSRQALFNVQSFTGATGRRGEPVMLVDARYPEPNEVGSGGPSGVGSSGHNYGGPVDVGSWGEDYDGPHEAGSSGRDYGGPLEEEKGSLHPLMDQSLEVAGAASRWATPRVAAAPPAQTPMTNEMSTTLDGQELAVGDEIEALGSAPGGSRVWFRAKVVALRSRYPPIHVKFTATLEGVTNRLALPEPVTAYVNADGVRRIAG